MEKEEKKQEESVAVEQPVIEAEEKNSIVLPIIITVLVTAVVISGIFAFLFVFGLNNDVPVEDGAKTYQEVARSNCDKTSGTFDEEDGCDCGKLELEETGFCVSKDGIYGGAWGMMQEDLVDAREGESKEDTQEKEDEEKESEDKAVEEEEEGEGEDSNDAEDSSEDEPEERQILNNDDDGEKKIPFNLVAPKEGYKLYSNRDYKVLFYYPIAYTVSERVVMTYDDGTDDVLITISNPIIKGDPKFYIEVNPAGVGFNADKIYTLIEKSDGTLSIPVEKQLPVTEMNDDEFMAISANSVKSKNGITYDFRAVFSKNHLYLEDVFEDIIESVLFY